ncbi:MAG TPA: OmpA family protein, partial [Vicinamibacteria bacterium]|nr:OmpA family protein [Vicinamibacteria bacterium]
THDEVEFTVGEEETQKVEGQKTRNSYALKEGAAAPSYFQLRKNYENAVKSLGGSILHTEEAYLSGKIVRGGQEVWVQIEAANSATVYDLTVVEKKAMIQEVTAHDMLDALNRDGFIALYINFDTARADIRPDSQPTVDQIAALLKQNPALKVGIEGHTDNIGTPAQNKTLSEQRANAVMTAIAKQGVAASRMSAVGWGQEKPVADNRTEAGRAKNRRVELVKK